MNIYFCGIGGVGLGPLAEFALDAGHTVQGSDPTESLMTRQLAERGVPINVKQGGKFLQTIHDRDHIDWFVYTAGVPETHPEVTLARQLGIKTTKRDELINHIIKEKNLKLIAVTGTHGKTTTQSMLVWTLQQLDVPVSYMVGTTMSFGPSGKYVPNSTYLVYECDEFDKNFLQFNPFLSLVTSIDYDHPDTYGTPEDYLQAFKVFLAQSEGSVLWQGDANLIGGDIRGAWTIAPDEIPSEIKLVGDQNRHNASLVIKAIERLDIQGEVLEAINKFPGIDRRFEKLLPNLYTDYGHHPVEIAATLQMAGEVSDDVVLVYQPHQNIRQHEVRAQYADCFEGAKDIYWLPTYLTREDPNLPVLTPKELTEDIENFESVHISDMNGKLWEEIQKARDRGALVLIMGAGSIDDWVRTMAATRHSVSILAIDMNGNYVLQQLDDADAKNPGKLAMFSGNADTNDASLRDSAAKAVNSITNLKINPENLSYFKMLGTNDVDGMNQLMAYYVLTGVDASNLEVFEGRKHELVGPNELGKHNLALETRTIITEYTHPAG